MNKLTEDTIKYLINNDCVSRKMAIDLAFELDYEGTGVLNESKCREIESRFNMLPSVSTQIMYGYDLNEICLFAEACRLAGVSNWDLKEFANNVKSAYLLVRDDAEKTMEKMLTKISNILQEKGKKDDE